jgi:DnaJ family protein C protein 2
LSKYRYKATDEQIKRAHRKKVLKHHPDKKAAQGGEQGDNFFKCIQKATEVLLDPVKRRQWDSVDEGADIEPPTKKQSKEGKFYKLWGNVFDSEARFSKIQPVPKFGNEKSSKEDVETFYNFWYSFDSWRSFEYLDEDIPDDNESRGQRRHVEKKNLNARRKRKTEDSARVRELVDQVLALDERIKLFKQAERANKNKKKNNAEEEAKKAAEEAAAKKEAEAKAKAEAEEKEKVEKAESKKAKEAAKNAVKKNKRSLKLAVKDSGYFTAGEASAAVIDKVLGDLDKVMGAVDNEGLAALAAATAGKKGNELKMELNKSVESSVKAGKLKDGEVASFA